MEPHHTKYQKIWENNLKEIKQSESKHRSLGNPSIIVMKGRVGNNDFKFESPISKVRGEKMYYGIRELHTN